MEAIHYRSQDLHELEFNQDDGASMRTQWPLYEKLMLHKLYMCKNPLL